MGLQVHLGAAMLRALEAGRVAREFFVAKGRGCQTNAIDVTGRQTGGTAQAHEQGVDVGTFAAEVAGFQHGFDVAFTAAAHLGFAPGIGHDPIVNGAGFVQVALGALGGFHCRGAHNAIGGQELGGAGLMAQRGGVFRAPQAGRGREVLAAVLCADPAGHFHKGLACIGVKFCAHHAKAIDAITQNTAAAVAAEARVQGGLPGRFQAGDRDPDTCGAFHGGDVHAGGDFKFTPGTRTRLETARGRGNRLGKGSQGRSTERAKGCRALEQGTANGGHEEISG